MWYVCVVRCYSASEASKRTLDPKGSVEPYHEHVIENCSHTISHAATW